MSDPAPTDGAPKKRGVGRPFEKNNRFGRGNPLATRQAEYRRAFAEAITPEAMADLAAAMYKAALKGDVQAAKLIMEHVCGRPQVAIEDGDDELPSQGTIEVRFIPAPVAPPSA